MLMGLKDEDVKGMAQRLAKMYDIENIQDLLEDPKCGKCGLAAAQRCSICKQEWYCRYSQN